MARAIGSKVKTLRLASELTGYKLNMMLEDEYHARQQNEAQQYLDPYFVSRLDIEEDLAMALVEMGFTSLEEIAYVPAETFDEIGLDEEVVELLQSVPKKQTHWPMHYSSKKISRSKEPVAMEGMTQEIAYALYRIWCHTIDDLADQATDDIAILKVWVQKKRVNLIMKARIMV